MQEVLLEVSANMGRASTPAYEQAARAQWRTAMARLEAEPLPEADSAAPRSLEALRLEDPAAMSGCWNPGCAAGPMTGCLSTHDDRICLQALCRRAEAGPFAACWQPAQSVK